MEARVSAAAPLRVALIWNGAIYDERLLDAPTDVVLGEGARALFPLPEGVSDAPNITLLSPDAQGYHLQPLPKMGGFVALSGQRHSARGLREAMALRGGDYGLITLGSTTVFFQQVRGVSGEAPRRSFRDGALLACLGLSVFVHVASLLFLFLVAAKELAPTSALELDSELVRKFMVTPPPDELLSPAARKAAHEREERGVRDREEASGAKAKGEQGKVGKRDSTKAKTEIAGAPADAVAQQVRGLGLLGVLAGGKSHAMASALDTPSLDSLLGGLGAAQTVIGHGSGGMATRGGGSGGGGKANGVLYGAGDLGTAVAGGKGAGRGAGNGAAGGGRGTHEVQLSLGGEGARVSGFLSKEQINRVVQANRAAIKYCFETALQRKPNLQGAVNVQWRIDRKGLVSSTRVAKSTLGDAGVEGCILRQIQRWKFPEPDGGEVDVVYPFLFREQ
jgi:TonB family protein